jgi:hypothetical protein
MIAGLQLGVQGYVIKCTSITRALFDGASPRLTCRLPLRFARWPMATGPAGGARHPGRADSKLEIWAMAPAGESARQARGRQGQRCGAGAAGQGAGAATSRLRLLRGATSRDKLVQLDG